MYWGVSNSSFQVEGEPADSDWRRWCLKKNIADGSNAEKATSFWRKYEEDFLLAQELGVNAFRLSIAWERIQPTRDEWNLEALEHYKKMVLSLREKGIEVFLTLHHFVLPGWLADEGGVLSENFVDAFAEYARVVFEALSPEPYKVRYWMTFNEPMVWLNFSYLDGRWPPGKVGASHDVIQGMKHVAEAHWQVYSRLKNRNPHCEWGIAKHWRLFHAQGINPLSGLMAKISRQFFNRQLLNVLSTGRGRFWMPGAGVQKMQLSARRRSSLDFLGVNYYGRLITRFIFQPPFASFAEGPGQKTDLGWEIYPKGIKKVIAEASQYNAPVYITENGLADGGDQHRPEFLKEHIRYMMEAKHEGHDVRGYFHWSLTDNFEWSEGLEPRFGLVKIDYKSGARQKRPSFDVYKEIVQKELR